MENDILKKLKELKVEAGERYRVREMGLFGSFVRGEQSARSDIDVLVEFDSEADLFDCIGLAIFLEEKLSRKVDVVSENALRIELKDTILREVIYA